MKDPNKAQDEIIQDFELFDDWMSRYQYLIDLGRELPPLDDAERTDDRLLEGCQSRVWMLIDGDGDEMRIRANSDAAIVSGLIALLTRVYSGCSPRQVLDTPPRFIEAIGLSQHLSPTRANGLYAMLEEIRRQARARLDTAPA